MNTVIDMATGKEVSQMPGGVVGQISLRRMIAELRRVGEFGEAETITHLEFDLAEGVIKYRVEVKAAAK